MSKDNSGSITDARERLARTISGEFAREDTLIWRLSVGTADRFLATLNLTPESATALMDGTAVVAHERGNTDHKHETPADLAERAARYWREKDGQMQDVHFPDLLAAFAAEYAAEECEACAKVALEHADREFNAARLIAAAIRARKGGE